MFPCIWMPSIPCASCHIRKIEGCACAGNGENVFPPSRVSDPDIHHGTCVTRVPCCIPGSLTRFFLWNWGRGKRSNIPGACVTRNFTYLANGPCDQNLRILFSTHTIYTVTPKSSGILQGFIRSALVSCNGTEPESKLKQSICVWSTVWLNAIFLFNIYIYIDQDH